MKRYILLIILAVTCAQQALAAQCGPYSSTEIYEGETFTGYKGAMEQDSMWLKYVRRVLSKDTTYYAFRRAATEHKKDLFESITPIKLGKRLVFVARRTGWNEVLDINGRELVSGVFGDFEKISVDHQTSSPNEALLKLFDPENTHFTFVLFKGSKTIVRALHWYQNSCSIPASASKHSLYGNGFLTVIESGKAGVLRLQDLQEIVPLDY